MTDPENRKKVLDEIFRRMSEHVDPEKASNADAVLHWKILDRPDGGYDHYEVVARRRRLHGHRRAGRPSRA